MCVTVAGLLLLVMFVFCIIDLRRRAKLTKAAEMDRIDDFDVKLIEYVTLMKSRLTNQSVSVGVCQSILPGTD